MNVDVGHGDAYMDEQQQYTLAPDEQNKIMRPTARHGKTLL